MANRPVSQMKRIGIAGVSHFLFLAICLWAAGCGGPSDRSVPSAPADPLKAQFEVSATTGPFHVTLKVLKTELAVGESLWVQVVYRNVGTTPIIIAKEELEPPSRFFNHMVGMKFKFKAEDGESLSYLMGMPMDSHPPLDCMTQAEIERLFGKGPPRAPGVQVLPGAEVATQPYAFWRAYDEYCRRTPPPVGKPPFSEIAQAGSLLPGRYFLEARLEKYFLSGPGTVAPLSVDFPAVPIIVRP